jgi:hypothetical protein
MKITLPNGLVIDGDQEQIADVLKKLGFDGVLGNGVYYFSETKGPVLITGMHTMHLRNAILKFYQKWVDSLHEIKNPALLIKKMLEGIEDVTWLAMVKEYSTRKEE